MGDVYASMQVPAGDGSGGGGGACACAYIGAQVCSNGRAKRQADREKTREGGGGRCKSTIWRWGEERKGEGYTGTRTRRTEMHWIGLHRCATSGVHSKVRGTAGGGMLLPALGRQDRHGRGLCRSGV